MILFREDGYQFEIFAVKQIDKNGKIHIVSAKSLMSLCSRRFTEISCEIDKIESIENLEAIMRDQQICLKCKDEVNDDISRGYGYLQPKQFNGKII